MKKPSFSFEFSEFKVSKDHPELAAKIMITDIDKIKIYALCQGILQPVRSVYGPTIILSAKRSQELNKAVGGASTSDHLYEGDSAAVDFTVPSAKMSEIYATLQRNPERYGQLIYYPKQNFIHVSLPSKKHQGESFTK